MASPVFSSITKKFLSLADCFKTLNKMKSVLVFAFFAVVAVAHANDDEALKEKLGQVTKECAEKTNFSEEGIKKLHSNDLSLTENIQCFQKCFFESSGIITDQAFDKERILAIGRVYKKDEAQTKENLEKCGALYKPDAFDCDAAWEIFKCFH
ncbi:general odorant-binding protein 56a-like [Bradysia coprophila]|uniref:general odorant-binding protein 56a-like n=1 Tax=Bradysia coprophila TaxID=38358 RepID=UPI00187D7374|nr:general odorant-binding protein 56a-like [Bradysia coprophila]